MNQTSCAVPALTAVPHWRDGFSTGDRVILDDEDGVLWFDALGQPFFCTMQLERPDRVLGVNDLKRARKITTRLPWDR